MPETPFKFFLTTPIYYVNARPHIGHAYTTIVADVLARRSRAQGVETWFLTGTDEHGQKIERSAAAAGIPPQRFADDVSAAFRTLWDRMGITNDDFIRTTEPRHKRGAQKLFAELFRLGHIYLSSYTGQYSVGEEMFVEGPPGTLGPDGKPTETVTEENFFFRLSAFQLPLLNLIESNTLQITPEARKNEVLSFLRGNVDLEIDRYIHSPEHRNDPILEDDEVSGNRQPCAPAGPNIQADTIDNMVTEGILARSSKRNSYLPGTLRDLSVSRSSFTWGIPVPQPAASQARENHVIYVWLDALANYMTAIGYGSEDPADKENFARLWPADLHLVGKEIIRFHCVYWPAFLLALNPKLQHQPGESLTELTLDKHLEWAAKWLPKAVTAHGWLLFDDSKMSKSKGNIVRTETILDAFGEHVYKKQFPDSTKAQQDLFAADVLRYFLLREIPFGQDGSFSFDSLVTRYNADLANGYGNLVSRTLTMIGKFFANSYPNPEVGSQSTDKRTLLGGYWRGARVEDELDGFVIHLPSEAQALIRAFGDNIEDLRFARAFEALWLFIGLLDGEITAQAPWKAVAGLTEEQMTGHRAVVLYTAAESIRIITALLYPILPYATAFVWHQLGLGDIEHAATQGKLNNLQWGGLAPGTRLGALAPIFPRADKGLAHIMTQMEQDQNAPTANANAQHDAVTSEASEFKESPIASEAPALTPAPSKLVDETFTTPAPPSAAFDPAAGPRTASLPEPNAGAHVAGSAALTTERPGTPSHTEASASGIFAQTGNRASGGAGSPSGAGVGAGAGTPFIPEPHPGTTGSSSAIAGAGAPFIPESYPGMSGSTSEARSPALPADFNPQITIDDFAKVELRVAKIVVAERIPKADKLLRLEVDLGHERRQILSGIAEWYTPEDLLGRRIVVITNLAPRKMRGLESHGMLLAASAPAGEGEKPGKPALATFADTDDLPLGSRLK